jgi:prepilin-type N-terminal cleavage/methylation domain-containing protein
MNMNQYHNKKHSRGFTLIEMMVATALFVVVITIGIGSIISVTRAHRVTAELRQATDTLYFVLEDITRNVRLGTVFRCQEGAQAAQDCPITTAGQAGSTTLSFTNYLAPRGEVLYPNDPAYLYTYQLVYDQGTGVGKLIKTTSEGTLDMTPPTININLVESGFSVANAGIYPLVTIRLLGTIHYQNTVVPFNIETSISSRTL